MVNPLYQFAASSHEASEAGGDIFSSLGINGQMLLFQAVAFVILVVLMAKYVFPVLMKAVDDRQEKIDAGQKAAAEAEKKAAEAEERIAELMKEARAEAKDIVTTAKDEAVAMVADGEKKAKARAEKIVADAHDQLEKDVIAARKALHNDTIELVAMATEKVVNKAFSQDVDKKVIANSLKEEA
jgi:F-type H+-transporting ATPase subunit b